jgi:hypothetical protein|tara:strand:+ start:477 stop:884 length:408 start_codon:yes stop_codon:yes gene_type:complete
MAKRLILGKKGSDFGLFVSEPGTDVGSITNVKDFAFTTSDSAYKGNFLYQKNVNENDPTSNAVTGTLSNDSNNVTSNPGNTIFVASGGDFVPLGTSSGGTGNTGMNKATTFTNRGISYLKTSSTFKVTAMGNFFL